MAMEMEIGSEQELDEWLGTRLAVDDERGDEGNVLPIGEMDPASQLASQEQVSFKEVPLFL